MYAFDAWFRDAEPDLHAVLDNPDYKNTEWLHIVETFRDYCRAGWDAGIRWERKRRVMAECYAPNCERLRSMQDLLD